MAKPKAIRDAAEITWILLSTLGVAAAAFLIRMSYRDMHKLVSRVRRVLSSARHRRLKRRIHRWLNGFSDEDLAKVAYSLQVWSREGFPDGELFIERPPHYRWELKAGTGPREDWPDDPAPSLESLSDKSRLEIQSAIGVLLTNRSTYTLEWLEKTLASMATSPKVVSAEDRSAATQERMI